VPEPSKYGHSVMVTMETSSRTNFCGMHRCFVFWGSVSSHTRQLSPNPLTSSCSAGGWLSLPSTSLQYSSACSMAQPVVQLSLQYRSACSSACSMAQPAVWPSLQYGPACSSACSMAQPAVWLSLQYGPACSMAQSAVWPSLQCGPACSMAQPAV